MVQDTKLAHSDVHHKVRYFFESHQEFSAPKGTILVHFDERPTDIFFLTEGIVKQTAITQKGQEVILNIYKNGSFFPLMDPLASIPNRYAFTAMSACTGRKAPAKVVREFVYQNIDVSIDLNMRLLIGLHGMLLKTEKLMEKDAHTLILQTLATFNDRQLANTPLTHQDLADSTGLSRETVTRELSQLKDAGLISIHDHVITLLM